MKTISLLPIVALIAAAAVSAAPASRELSGNPCEYFGIRKDYCVDGRLRPEVTELLKKSSVDRHAPGSKRDDFMSGYEWPDETTELEKRSFNPDGYRGSGYKAETDWISRSRNPFSPAK